MAPLTLNGQLTPHPGRFTDGPTQQGAGWAPKPILALRRRGNSLAPIRNQTQNRSAIAIPI